MVAIAHRFADQYVLEPDQTRHLFLVFGPDSGLVSERSRLLLQSFAKLSTLPQRTLLFSGDALSSDPLVLLEEIHSLGLFDQSPPAIRISLGARNLVPTLELVAKSAPFEARVVIEAGPLKRTAPIRSWFEKHNFAIAIECYSDQTKDLRRLIDSEVSAAGTRIDNDVIDTLLGILGEDRLLSRLEIQKLLLYTHGQDNINRESALDVLASPTSINSDELFNRIFEGDVAATTRHFYNVANRTTEFNSIANNMLRFALAINHARTQMDGGSPIETVLHNLLRTINASNRPQAITAQLNSRPPGDTLDVVEIFYELVKEGRRTTILLDDKTAREFVKLAKGSEKKR